MEELGSPRHCLCAGLRRAARVASRKYDDALAESGLNVQQFTALFTLRDMGPCTVSQLAEALDLERTAATRNLGIMQRNGLVERREGDDRRERIVAITEVGKTRLAQAEPMWREAQQAMLAHLAKDDPAALLRQLANIH